MKITFDSNIEWSKPMKEPEILRLLQSKALKKYKIQDRDILNFKILKKSLDARKKPLLMMRFKLLMEVSNQLGAQLLKRFGKELSNYQKQAYTIPNFQTHSIDDKNRPVIVGAGPAGLFAAYYLCIAGLAPIVIEQGKNVVEREKDVEKYWNEGILNPFSNVQFGEGGAGTFSDGKLATGVKDPYGRIDYILQTFVKFGASENILVDAKPHIGTDVLKKVVKNMREDMIQKGATFHYETQFIRPLFEKEELSHIECQNVSTKEIFSIPCRRLILCTGHSARSTFKNLHSSGVDMVNKPFAVGFRMIHPQNLWNQIQYGDGYEKKGLPAADYKITYQTTSGRNFYSFCMCPGGYVVNASSIEGMVCCNGMSYKGRNSNSANSALVMNVSEDDFGKKLFSGMEFQNQLEQKTYEAGKGKLPVQSFGDYAKEVDALYRANQTNSVFYENFIPDLKGKTEITSLAGILPENLNKDFLEGVSKVGERIPGFSHDRSLLCGVETRTSSPIKMLRDENYESNKKGIYPCGEGAGYAGGITSAALDGLKVAESIAKYYNLI